MASIDVYNIGSTSISVRLTGLQTSGVDYTRKCTWTAYEKSSGNSAAGGNSYITQADGSDGAGGDFTLSGLSPNTEYMVTCIVYRTDTGAWLSSLPSVNVTTTGSGSGGGGGTSGGGTASDWAVSNVSLGTISTEQSKKINLGLYTCYCYSVSFAKSGIATFYTSNTSGEGDTRGYLTTSTSFDNRDGVPTSILSEDDDGAGYPDFSISYNVTSGTTYYIWVRDFKGDLAFTTYLHITPPQSTDAWTWSNQSKNAFSNNGETTDVPYTEWNEFVEFVADKTGYYLVDALMDSSDKTLYADKFNAVREAIGSKNTFKNGTNSIKDHFNATGSWDMSSGEVVKGQYFIDLTEYLNDIP